MPSLIMGGYTANDLLIVLLLRPLYQYACSQKTAKDFAWTWGTNRNRTLWLYFVNVLGRLQALLAKTTFSNARLLRDRPPMHSACMTGRGRKNEESPCQRGPGVCNRQRLANWVVILALAPCPITESLTCKPPRLVITSGHKACRFSLWLFFLSPPPPFERGILLQIRIMRESAIG